VLEAPELDAPALELAPEAPSGAEGAVIGFPENGPLTFTPARLGSVGTVTSQDSYGRGPVERLMTPFRAAVRSGNSGGPVVGTDGDVLTTVFAAATGNGRNNGLGVPTEVVAKALAGELAPTDTGPCAA
jgi:S1-C subfamily serine protease